MNGHREQAAERLRLGDPGGARAAAEAGLRLAPDDAALLQILGIACCQRGQLREGAAHLRRALALDSGDGTTRFHLVQALAALGDGAGAEAMCAADPRPLPPIMRLHAYLLQQLGRPEQSARVYEALLAAEPADFESWTNLGNSRLLAGDVPGAISALEKARALRADSPLIHLNLAIAFERAGRAEESEAAASEAVRLAPGHAPFRIEAARLLARQDRNGAAIAHYEAAIRAMPSDPQLRLEAGQARFGAGDVPGAEADYRAATALAPRLAAAWLALGSLLESSNRPAELPALIAEAEAAGVAPRELGWLRVQALRRAGRFEEALAEARDAPASTDAAERAQAIGELCDRLGDTEAAFAAFEEMNRLAADHPSNPRAGAAEYRRRLERVAALTTQAWYDSWPAAPAPEGRPAPVFLLGFPRSGTTLLDTVLMGHPGLHVLEELPVLQRVNAELGDLERLPALGADEVARLRALYFEEMDRIAPGGEGKLVVDKFPLAVGLTALIHRIFPDARFIFARRHPCDVVLSCFMTNFRLNPGVANFLDLGDAAALYDAMMSYWQKCRSIFPLQVHDFRYEAMVADMEGELRPLVDFLGLPWDERLLDHRASAEKRGFISSPSYAQVSEKIYSRAAGRWERYRDQMAPVLPTLAPWAARMGYRV